MSNTEDSITTMNDTMKLKRGFVPVMLTPFQENGSLDLKGLSKLTEFYLDHGASGLFANCLSSEMFELSDSERLKIIEHVVEVAGAMVPVVATGTFSGTIVEQADFVKRVYDAGVKGVIINTNVIAGKTDPDEVFNERMFHLMDLTDHIPIGLYECPREFKRLVSPAQLGLFVRTGRLVYHKDTSCDITQVRSKLLAVSEHPEFGFFDAYMGHAVESLQAGSSGLSCIQGNYWPQLIVWLCENYDSPSQLTQLGLIQDFLSRNMDIVHDYYPYAAKYYLQKMGVTITDFTRQNSGTITNEVRIKLDQLHQDYRLLLNQLDFAGTSRIG